MRLAVRPLIAWAPWVLIGVMLAGFLAALAVRQAEGPEPRAGGEPVRIVSMVPSLTEVLFALGLGDRVVGVTSFCNWPPEAASKPRLGGYLDPNCEALVALRPDLVIAMPEQAELRTRLEALGVRTLEVGQQGLAGILDSIRAIGQVCGAGTRAEDLVRELEGRMRAVSAKTQGLARPFVLVCVDRLAGSGRLEEICVAGRGGFHDELIACAGGVNAAAGAAGGPYPVFSKEGVIALDPEVIIDMLPDLARRGVSAQEATREWDELSVVKAVRRGRVHAFTEGYGVIPGPRFILALERMARLIHPEVEL